MKYRYHGYLEKDGSYNETGPPHPKGQSTSQKTWWESLSEGHRQVIAWYGGTFGQGMAYQRNLDTQEFSRSKGAGTMKGPEQHEFAFTRFDEFKAFCINKHIKPQI